MSRRLPPPGVQWTQEEAEAAERHSARIFRNQFKGEDAYSRHLKLVRDYLMIYEGGDLKKRHKANTEERYRNSRTEVDILRENHRFVRDLDEDESTLTWEQRVAKRYYDQLFKEYCLADLRYYREGKVAMRWRTKTEVVDGKGQFICGNIHCDKKEELTSWEVNFAYVEDGERKNTLVKLRTCPKCSNKLNYRKRQRKAEQEETEEQEEEQEEEGKGKRPLYDIYEDTQGIQLEMPRKEATSSTATITTAATSPLSSSTKRNDQYLAIKQ
ncbi:folate-sensitive fragile site protein Fra10Ac1-domain-containing protein [Syncephalis plumigaleata]|nr:folate-sensitive fragile site protein Fra10Ac1-domain-containing protein [Syncephalis plumigaleata]